MKNILTAISFFSIGFTFTQKEANTWYFGNYAGVSFTSGVPIPMVNSKLSTEEGCSVISNSQGKMLFYTDGISFWNSKHLLMANGTGLNGDPSSTQSGVAIAKPNHPGIYYLFTVAATAKAEGIEYSLIDMSLNQGLGDVVKTEKNVLLQDSVTEKMTAVLHRNGKDIWVIAHGWNNNEFMAYLVTEKGVNKTPIISKSGRIHAGPELNTQGYMKSNPDGSNLALALENDDIVEVFDFDNAKGIVSQPITIIANPKSYVYGVEFSSDGSLLYFSAAGKGEIYQINLQAGSPKAIQSSLTLIGKTTNGAWVGALQLSNDGKIYFSIYRTSFLGVIDNPNLLGAACGFLNNAVPLAGKIASLGLPTFSQSFFTQDQTAKNVEFFDQKTVALGKTLVLRNINFDFAKFSLQPSSFVELKKLVLVLKQNPGYKIQIFGHTDNIGNKSANILLSQNRAKAVKEYLQSQKIASDRISFVGYGSSKPIANNETEVGRAKNRRVDFVLSK